MNRRIASALAALCLVLLPSHAWAQAKTKAAITTEINTTLTTGCNACGTAAVMRGFLLDIVNSYLDNNGGTPTLTATFDNTFCATPGQILQRGASVWACATPAAGSSDLIPGCRITLETGVAFSSSDQSAKSTVFCTPVDSLTVQIYNGSSFAIQTMAGEISITLSGTSGNTAYDAYLIFDTGAVKGCWGPAWTTSTDGAGNRGSGAGTAQITNSVGGRWTNAVSMNCKNGASTFSVAANQGTLVGGFKTATADQVSDAAGTRMVWDLFRPISRTLIAANTASSYAYTSTTTRQCNAGSAGGGVPVQASAFRGMAGWPTDMRNLSSGSSSNASVQLITGGIGLNSTTANSAQVQSDNASSATYNQFSAPMYSEYRGQPPVGSNTFYCLEGGNANVTFYGNNGTTTKTSGMIGETRQ